MNPNQTVAVVVRDTHVSHPGDCDKMRTNSANSDVDIYSTTEQAQGGGPHAPGTITVNSIAYTVRLFQCWRADLTR